MLDSVSRNRLEGMRGIRDGPAMGDARIEALNALPIIPTAVRADMMGAGAA